MTEPRYTLAEARREIARQHCWEHGHDYSVISSRCMQDLAGQPINVQCDRCGTYWPVHGPGTTP